MEYSNKIYPPIIEANLPAIRKTKDGLYQFELPISYNRFNTPLQVTGCIIKVISAVTGKQICEEIITTDFKNNPLKNVACFTLPTVFYKLAEEYDPLETYYSNQSSTSFYEVDLPLGQDSFIPNHFFIIDKEKSVKWIVGNYYKIQAAFIFQDGTPPIEYISAYSSFGITKLISTTGFDVNIAGLSTEVAENSAKNYYTGEFKINDRSERIKEYCFRVYTIDTDNGNFNGQNYELYYDTGPLLHDNSTNYINDNGILCGQDFFEAHLILKDLENYYIEYEITTINNYTSASEKYLISNYFMLPPEINCMIYAQQNYITNGIDVYMKGIPNENNEEDIVSGHFILLRTQYDTSNEVWGAPQEILKIDLDNTIPSEQEIVGENLILKDRLLWQDYTVEQGLSYKYYLQQYWYGNINNNNQYFSEYISSDVVVPVFEDATLFDGEKQLIIKYNPKISSFKTTKIDSKQDTIGSKFPFIFRGANTNYKEFTISGLISYTADELGSFDKKYAVNENVTRENTPTDQNNFNIRSYDLTADNFVKERQFKLEVLDWLNDGKVKLFRSPSEGNYLVRLMNVSLTPNETVGRMLHTFTCTAYEVADCNFFSLVNEKIIQKNSAIFQQHKIIEGIFSTEIPTDGKMATSLVINDEQIRIYPALDEEEKIVPETFYGTVRIPVVQGMVIEFYETNESNSNLLLSQNISSSVANFVENTEDKRAFQLIAGPNLYYYEIPLYATGYFLIKVPESTTSNTKIFYDKVINTIEETNLSSYYKDEFLLQRERVVCAQILEDPTCTTPYRFLKGGAGPIMQEELGNNLSNIFNTFKFYTLRFETGYINDIDDGMDEQNFMIKINNEEIDMRTVKYYERHNLTNITQLWLGKAVTLTWSGYQWRRDNPQ